jgi:CPA2 family monovalent cation:H+ antiporter-2
MPEHHTPLIATIAAGLVLAFALGLVAHRLRVQPLVGYLLAGVLVGPFTPGFVADQALAVELAEIGVILLMFGVGLHFSLKDLVSVARIAVPGAIGQIATATLMGGALAMALGWDLPAALVFGLALSVASTVVLVRALQERRMLETERGRIAVGWLIVEDLAMIIALVMLPAIAAAMAAGTASPGQMLLTLGITLAKVAAFVAVMLLAGRRVIPWVMHYAAHTGSRELFRLAVYATALGIAFGAYKLFDASFALGAFFAGMVLGETKLSQRATEEAMPLRDAFAVLFFVSVGMLLNPAVLIEQPLAVLATVLIIVVGKSVAAYLIVRAFGYPSGTALTVSASLAQIGEFSFILIGLGITLGMIPVEGRDLVLAGAILSILLNPLVFTLIDRRRARAVPLPSRETPEAAGTAVPDAAPLDLPPSAPPPTRAEPPMPPSPAAEAGPVPTGLTDHDVVVGYGRVGSVVGARLAAAGRPVLVFEERDEALAAARRDGAEVIVGNAADPEMLALANLAAARRLFVTIPEAFEAGQVVQQARAVNPGLEILARAHSDDCVRHLDGLGATLTILGEREIAQRMIERAFPAWAAPGSAGRDEAGSAAPVGAG